MSGFALRRALLLLVLILLLGVLVGGVRERLGAGVVVEASLPQACVAIEAPAGPEDLAIDPDSGMAVISATDRRAATPARGGLWLLDVEDPAARPLPLRGELPAVFRPHGLSLLRTDDGLFVHVVNHLDSGHSIELLRIDPLARTLEHRATFSGSALVSPNDVAAVDLERFYVSNDHGNDRAGLARLAEDLLGLNGANVVYHDGARFVPVLEDLTFANGITLSGNGQLLYVSETLDRTVSIYTREPLSGRLAPQTLIELGAGPDNLDIASDGSLWIAAHPNLLDFIRHASDPGHPSPSVVYRVASEAGELSVRRVLADAGRRYAGISVAAHHDGVTVLGDVFDARLMRCTAVADAPAEGRVAPLDLPGG